MNYEQKYPLGFFIGTYRYDVEVWVKTKTPDELSDHKKYLVAHSNLCATLNRINGRTYINYNKTFPNGYPVIGNKGTTEEQLYSFVYESGDEVKFQQLVKGVPIYHKPDTQEKLYIPAILTPMSVCCYVLECFKHDTSNLPHEVSIEMKCCLLYTSPSPRDRTRSRMPSSA